MTAFYLSPEGIMHMNVLAEGFDDDRSYFRRAIYHEVQLYGVEQWLHGTCRQFVTQNKSYSGIIGPYFYRQNRSAASVLIGLWAKAMKPEVWARPRCQWVTILMAVVVFKYLYTCLLQVGLSLVLVIIEAKADQTHGRLWRDWIRLCISQKLWQLQLA